VFICVLPQRSEEEFTKITDQLLTTTLFRHKSQNNKN